MQLSTPVVRLIEVYILEVFIKRDLSTEKRKKEKNFWEYIHKTLRSLPSWGENIKCETVNTSTKSSDK